MPRYIIPRCTRIASRIRRQPGFRFARASFTRLPRVQTAAPVSTDTCNEERACRAPWGQATSGFLRASARFRAATSPASRLGDRPEAVPLLGLVEAVDDLVPHELLRPGPPV